MTASVADALALALSQCAPGPSERVALTEACGRILRDPLDAAEDVPTRPTSMMDGFAVRSGAAATLRVVEESAAGRPSARLLADGEAAPISTGAILPDGADAIVPIEDVVVSGAEVDVPATEARRFVRMPGSELRRGERLLDAGLTIDGAAISILASEGRGDVAVGKRPTVAILSTGAELLPLGAARAPGMLHDSNGPALQALVRAAGGAADATAIVGDDRDATIAAIKSLRGADLLLISGGVSVGEHDHVRPAIEALGGQILLWRVAMKPGKPLMLARLGETRVVGLPGNPVSAQVGFWLFVRPMLRALLGATPADDLLRVEALLRAPLSITTDRPTFLRARVTPEGATLHATIGARQGSAALSSLLGANALVRIEPGAHALAVGAPVPALLLP